MNGADIKSLWPPADSPSPTPRQDVHNCECKKGGNPVPLEMWSTHELSAWLHLKLMRKYNSAELVSRCVQGIIDHVVDGETVGMLTADAWKELIPFVGPRSYAMDLVRDLLSRYSSDTRPRWPPTASETKMGQKRSLSKEPPSPPPKEPPSAPPPAPAAPAAPSAMDQASQYRWEVTHDWDPTLLSVPEIDHTPMNFVTTVKTGFGQSAFTNAKSGKDFKSSDVHGLSFTQKLTAYTGVSFVRTAFFLRAVVSLFSLRPLVGILLNTLLVWTCHRQGWAIKGHNPTALVSAVVFPIAFAINSAYSRGELALMRLCLFKCNALTLMATHAHWSQFVDGASKKWNLHVPPRIFFALSLTTMKQIQENTNIYLGSDRLGDVRRKAALHAVYVGFIRMSMQVEMLRDSGCPPPLCGSGVQAIRDMLGAFEMLRTNRDYQTPVAISVYNQVALPMLMIWMAPFWANVINVNSTNPNQQNLTWIIYVLLNVLYLVMEWLVSVQRQLECPFGSDQDDICLSQFFVPEDYAGELMMQTPVGQSQRG